MRFLTRSLTGLFLLAVTVGLIAVSVVWLKEAIDIRMAPAAPGRPAEERSFSARVATLEPQRIAPTLTAYGAVQSRRTLELRAKAAGQIVELGPDFESGGRAQAGALLLRIDPADAQSAFDLARATLKEAEVEARDAARAHELARADLALAEEQVALRRAAYDRQKGLGDRGFGTTTDLETAELALATANQSLGNSRQAVAQGEARIDKAATALDRQKLALADAQRRLNDTELRAEFGGVLSGVTVVAGGLIGTSDKLGELIDPDHLEVLFRVSTAEFRDLSDDRGALRPLPMSAALDIYGSTITAQGVLSRVDATVGAGSSGRLVFATLDAPQGLKPGDFVTVRVEEPALEGVARLPAAAIGVNGSLLVVAADNRLEEAPVEVVRREGNEVIVRVGALAGREVVTERSPFLGAGILIRPVRTDGQSGAVAAEAEKAAMIDLTTERRAELVALVEGDEGLPKDAKERLLGQLRTGRVPAEMVQRIEAREGG